MACGGDGGERHGGGVAGVGALVPNLVDLVLSGVSLDCGSCHSESCHGTEHTSCPPTYVQKQNDFHYKRALLGTSGSRYLIM
jgi:hypothetical protein